MNFNLSRLRYLYEVAQCGSMRAASEKMNVAPSSVSRQIAILEDELGVEVLERGRGKAKLTEAGEMAVKYYRDDLGRKEILASHLNDIQGLRRGSITIAMGEGFVSDLLSEAMQAFMGEYPEIEIDVRVAGTNQVLSLVEEDEAHIGMVFDCPSLPRITVQQAYNQPLKAVMAASHALAGRKSVSLADFMSLKYALPQKNFRIREVLDEAAYQEKLVLDPVLTSNSLLILKNMAMTPDGVTVLPDIAILKELKAGHLVSIPVESASLSNTSADIVTRLGRLLPGAAREFLKYLRAHFNYELQ
ncbi:LysR family transcriptional regulator [Paremcibacter congregatus]|uniref:LysR family transcriptional regulator n=1 Tax=Paremcibacter congregatus TaxID=2043170 RepID=A0A2G4YQM1_9PROT|nr:LysR family transcriptional regulator [Paremcibacter congregatus]PHZ84619.1 LysR family transcriptional regulator [Paremcibacter congregatus]QDE28840.1 LysR family transcriptional regulator [Paremcibacter congregatus]